MKVTQSFWLFVTPWTIHEFSRPEYWTREPFLSPGDLPNLGIQPRSPALQADSLPAEPQGKPKNTGVGSLSLLQQIFPTQKLNRVSCIAGGFLTNFLSRTFLSFPDHSLNFIFQWLPANCYLIFSSAVEHHCSAVQSNPGSFEGIVLDVSVRYLFWHQEGSSRLLLYLVLSCRLSSLEFSLISSSNLQISITFYHNCHCFERFSLNLSLNFSCSVENEASSFGKKQNSRFMACFSPFSRQNLVSQSSGAGRE